MFKYLVILALVVGCSPWYNGNDNPISPSPFSTVTFELNGHMAIIELLNTVDSQAISGFSVNQDSTIKFRNGSLIKVYCIPEIFSILKVEKDTVLIAPY
jgi:hypothetical protein